MRSVTASHPNTTMDNPRRSDRSQTYAAIGRLIWLRYCLENDLGDVPYEHAPTDWKRSVTEASEAIANMVLDPDRRDAALMCMADRLVEGVYHGDLTIRDVSKQTATQYLNTAQSGLGAFLLNLMEVPPDPHYREEMTRLLDAIAPKAGVM